MTDAELMARMNAKRPPHAVLLGQKILALDTAAGTVSLEFTAKPEFCNPMGTVQGGFVAAMLDDAAALAAIMKSGKSIGLPTLEFKVTFFAAARPGILRADGRCIRFGRTIAFMESQLYDTDGKLLASMTTTAMPVDAAAKPLKESQP